MSKLKKKLNETDLELDDLYTEYEEINDDKDKTLSKKEERIKMVRRQITAISLIGAFIVIGGIVAISISNSQDDKKSDNKETTANVQETTTELILPEEETYVLEEDKYPEITELVKLYYKATLKGDTASISKYVDNIEEVNMDKIKAENEYIKKYKNITCYTMTGLYDNTYVVFVYYEIKFKNIETLAPAISMLYIIQDDDTGLYYIHNGVTQDTELNSYVEALMQNPEIVALMEQTNAELSTRMEQDAGLKEFVENMQEGAKTETATKEAKKEEASE